ncbi:DUF3221 domain-containing protein [Lysinibacillus sp. FSL M8-0134]|uniref:DUF3221 domain-containing protein n=1 Tax=Lysinibacillus sp. FSL M8-0134 TaxID=2921717 RepID=UPI0031194344
MRKLSSMILLLFLSLSLWGCAGKNNEPNIVDEASSNDRERVADIEGIIIDKTEKSITVVWNVAEKDLALSKREILELAMPNAFIVFYSDTSDFTIGDRVAIWTTGTYLESYPAQGTATTIQLIEK